MTDIGWHNKWLYVGLIVAAAAVTVCWRFLSADGSASGKAARVVAVAASDVPNTHPGADTFGSPAVSAPEIAPESAHIARPEAGAIRSPPAESAMSSTALPASAPSPDPAAEQALGALLQTLKSDTVPGNRLAAIDQLRVLGKQGDRDARIETALRASMSDSDPSVAVNARDALSDLLD